ncbi:DUF1064 domain-containing protein [uncultured Phascolarctobacterium sp.]|uniref:DUF1064 domain-containing protein n=1 Tax=uncultured Phascolarctobacterium sp. TaxID=512296 RepID=UPI002619F5ED|nr:DUF1064 domain-containing protein [uncultured Phascolarctobacterium sp.]
MTTWNELPAHLVSKIRSDSVTVPANLPGAVPVLKYGNRVTEVDGIRFDSEKEADYYWQLHWMMREGTVKEVELQPKFVLQPGYKREGKKIRPIIYKADFKVTEAGGHVYYVDTKGMKTPVYLLKKKMLLYKYPDIDFREV